MALLYLLGERTGVDEDGVRWVRDDDGSWQPRQEPRPRHLYLLRSDSYVVEEPPPEHRGESVG